MSEFFNLSFIFLIGLVSSFFGTMVGGGTLLSLPLLIIAGLPPQVAIATERFGGLGQTTASFLKFSGSKKIVWKYVTLLTVISLAGSLIGSNILIKTDPRRLHSVVGLTLIFLLPLIFLKPDLGIQNVKTSKNKIVAGSLIYFLIQTFAAFFGGGTGILASFILMFFFGLTIIESTATKIIPWFFLSTSSLAIFALNGIVNYKIGAILLMGMVLGGYTGAHVALKKGDAWVRRLFSVLVFISTLKLLFF